MNRTSETVLKHDTCEVSVKEIQADAAGSLQEPSGRAKTITPHEEN